MAITEYRSCKLIPVILGRTQNLHFAVNGWFRQRWSELCIQTNTLFTLASRTAPTVPELLRPSQNCSDRPRTVPTVPELFRPSQNCSDRPRTAPTVPELLRPSQNCSDRPRTVPTVPELLRPSQNCSDRPRTVPTVPELSDRPRTVPTIPELFRPFQNCSDRPRTVPHANVNSYISVAFLSVPFKTERLQLPFENGTVNTLATWLYTPQEGMASWTDEINNNRTIKRCLPSCLLRVSLLLRALFAALQSS